MEKDQLKVETHYSANIKVKGEYETLNIIQEFSDRKAIKFNFFQERWRTPKDTIELLQKAIIVIEKFDK